MTIHISYFDAQTLTGAFAGIAAASVQGILGAQLGDADTLALNGATPVPGTTAPKACVALIKTTEACRLNVVAGSGAAAATSGWWAAGEVGYRYLAAGQRISVVQP